MLQRLLRFFGKKVQGDFLQQQAQAKGVLAHGSSGVLDRSNPYSRRYYDGWAKTVIAFFPEVCSRCFSLWFVSIPCFCRKQAIIKLISCSAKPLIGLLYAVICVVEYWLFFTRKKMWTDVHVRKQSGFREQSDRGGLSGKLRFRGHHPDCEEFSGNRITVRNVVLCAACMGMLFGAAIALIGAILYFFVGFITLPTNFVVFFVGYGVCMLGLVQYKFEAGLSWLSMLCSWSVPSWPWFRQIC